MVGISRCESLVRTMFSSSSSISWSSLISFFDGFDFSKSSLRYSRLVASFQVLSSRTLVTRGNRIEIPFAVCCFDFENSAPYNESREHVCWRISFRIRSEHPYRDFPDGGFFRINDQKVGKQFTIDLKPLRNLIGILRDLFHVRFQINLKFLQRRVIESVATFCPTTNVSFLTSHIELRALTQYTIDPFSNRSSPTRTHSSGHLFYLCHNNHLVPLNQRYRPSFLPSDSPSSLSANAVCSARRPHQDSTFDEKIDSLKWWGWDDALPLAPDLPGPRRWHSWSSVSNHSSSWSSSYQREECDCQSWSCAPSWFLDVPWEFYLQDRE